MDRWPRREGLSGHDFDQGEAAGPGKSRHEAIPGRRALFKLRRRLIRPERVYRSSLIEQLARETGSHPIGP